MANSSLGFFHQLIEVFSVRWHKNRPATSLRVVDVAEKLVMQGTPYTGCLVAHFKELYTSVMDTEVTMESNEVQWATRSQCRKQYF